MYESCLSVNNDVKDLLFDYAQKYNISVCEFSKRLIAYACKCSTQNLIRKRLVEYQKNFSDSDLVKFRYRLSEDEFVLFFTTRFRLRVSVSMLLVIGLLIFLEKNKENRHNYTTLIRSIYSCVQNFLKSINFREIKLE